jgi:hypothetical protein
MGEDVALYCYPDAGPRLVPLLRGAGRPVRATGPPATLVCSPGDIQAQQPVRSAADHSAVVIVLAVVFPTALVADVVAAGPAPTLRP